MSWACGGHFDQCHSIKLCAEANEDISIKMKRRVQRGYGLEVGRLVVIVYRISFSCSILISGVVYFCPDERLEENCADRNG